jgi:hypothetical protein
MKIPESQMENTCLIAPFHNKRSLLPPLFNEVSVPNFKPGECTCVRDIPLSLFQRFPVKFWNSSDGEVF